MRDFLLRSVAFLGTATLAVTEVLSPFHLLRRVPLAIAWILIFVAMAFWFRRSFQWDGPSFSVVRQLRGHYLEPLLTAVIFGILAVIAYTALLSPPNSADAMAYHLPRVIYWVQSGSVGFFPTSYFNQISLQPFAEYVMLHTYVLTGGDHLINLVAFFAFVIAIIAVSAIAREMGLGTKGQALAALFCATLPNAILQASGAKNDLLLSALLATAIYFAFRRQPVYLGLSLGLALATKATAYLFAPPLLLAVALMSSPRRASALKTVLVLVIVLFLNTPQYLRNIQLSGSPLGPDSAQGDGVFRWRNDHPGWRSTVSNFLRDTSDQIGMRSERWNQAVFHAVVNAHHALGLDPDDPATTWPYTKYRAPYNAQNHEADANNRWHLLLAAVAALLALALRKRAWTLYAAALFTAFLLFCFYLKWQLYLARLEIPLFILAAPLAAFLVDALRLRWLACIACVFLINNVRAPLFENWTRRLHGPGNLYSKSRDQNYFNDMVQWNNRASYLPAVDLTLRSGCESIGIDITRNQLEYPYQALLLERDPRIRFFHVGVENASARYAPPHPPVACAVFCPDCAGIRGKIEAYHSTGPPADLDGFLVFVGPKQ